MLFKETFFKGTFYAFVVFEMQFCAIWSCFWFFYGIPSPSVQNVILTRDGLTFPRCRARVQRETKVYECRHKSGEADAELQRGVDDLFRSRVPCSHYTVSTSLRA